MRHRRGRQSRVDESRSGQFDLAGIRGELAVSKGNARPVRPDHGSALRQFRKAHSNAALIKQLLEHGAVLLEQGRIRETASSGDLTENCHVGLRGTKWFGRLGLGRYRPVEI